MSTTRYANVKVYEECSPKLLPNGINISSLNTIGDNDSNDNNYGFNSLYYNDLQKPFLTPDKSVSIIKTYRSDLVFLDAFGMAQPIRTDESFTTRAEFAKALNQNSDINKRHGVYILTMYKFRAGTDIPSNMIENLIRYYNSNNLACGGDIGIRDYIITNYAPKNPMDKRIPKDLEVITCTFIPKSILDLNPHVYIPNSNIVITSSKELQDIAHPDTETYKQYKKSLASDCINFIEIEINDPEAKGDYYIKVGSLIRSIKPTKDSSRPSTISVMSYRNQELINSDDIVLSRHKELGIYTTEEEAKYNGDLKLKFEEFKILSEFARIKQEADFNREKRVLEVELMKEKKDAEVEYLKEKKDIEMEYMKEKKDIEMEYMKEKKDIELEQLNAKLRHEHELHRIKCAAEAYHLRSKQHAQNVDIVGKIFGQIALPLAKTFFLRS